MYINLIPVWDKGQRGGGRFFIKEQWEKSLLPLGPDSNNGYLLHWCTKIALKKIHIHMPLVNEVTDKMCKRTRRLIRTVNKFFFRKWIRRNCCRIKPGNKTTCWIALFILSLSSLRQKEVNNVFVHHKCECTYGVNDNTSVIYPKLWTWSE